MKKNIAEKSAGAGAHLEPAGPGDNPHLLARSRLESLEGRGHGVRVVYHRGENLLWEGDAYVPVPPTDVRAQLAAHVDREFAAAHAAALDEWAEKAEKGAKAPALRRVTTRLVGDVTQALTGECLRPSSVTPPAWINGPEGGDPRALLAMPGGVLDLRAAAARAKKCLRKPTPDFFTRNAVGYDFDEKAAAPQWAQFLSKVWGDGAAGKAKTAGAHKTSIRALRQWFGYCPTADTSQQKIFMLVGPKRSGKGTIPREHLPR